MRVRLVINEIQIARMRNESRKSKSCTGSVGTGVGGSLATRSSADHRRQVIRSKFEILISKFETISNVRMFKTKTTRPTSVRCRFEFR